jgi:uncharacterized protein YjbI with pentapeptide repeats
MANDEHVAMLKQGVAAWNEWRGENPNILPDLSGVDLYNTHLGGLNLTGANLSGADLREANFKRADLSGANLNRANLNRAHFEVANLNGANLAEAGLRRAWFDMTMLNRVNLSGAWLEEAHLQHADLSGAKLVGANLIRANLIEAKLVGANLVGADLSGAALLHTDLTGADLTGCHVFGMSAWGVTLNRAKQQNLVITQEDEPAITVDNIEVAQFIYLMLNNQKVSDVIDTITSKVVLILGRFAEERKTILDALREELRKRDYLPILFDFNVPVTRDITETVSLLARMARFIIADLTDPSSIPKELEAIVPGLAVPVQPLLLEAASPPYAMFKDYWKYDWVLPIYRYESVEVLLAAIADKVIGPAEGKVKALQERRRMIEAELTKPR